MAEIKTASSTPIRSLADLRREIEEKAAWCGEFAEDSLTMRQVLELLDSFEASVRGQIKRSEELIDKWTKYPSTIGLDESVYDEIRMLRAILGDDQAHPGPRREGGGAGAKNRGW